MNIIRRLIAFLLLVAAGLAAALGWQSYAVASTPGQTEDQTVLPILSPRRVPQVTGAVSQEAQLRGQTASIIAQYPPGSVCIDVERNGRPVISTNIDTPLIPASTAKLLTATAAIDVLGADRKFKTSVLAENKPKNGVVSGPLYLQGGGDPLLMTQALVDTSGGHRNIHSSMEALVDQVVSSGVKTVNGGIVADDSYFDHQRYLPTWESGYRTGGQVGPIGALMVNEGFVLPTRIAAADPAIAAANVFGDMLRSRGVAVVGGSDTGEVPSGSSTITSLDSLPVSKIVEEMLTESDNTTAEVLLKNIGVAVSKKGTFADGARAVIADLRNHDFPVDGVVLNDGSGLDRADRVTCHLLTALLAWEGPVLAGSLPKAGQTGTLADRYLNTPAVGRLVAKTGTLSNVSGLAGWANPDGQQPFDFAIISNGIPSTASRVAEDQLGLLLVNQPKEAPLSVIAPGATVK